MTFDLFADIEPAAAPKPSAPPVCPARAGGEDFTMQPTGDVNRWLYRGVPVIFDNRRKPGSQVGIWRTVEGIGRDAIHSDDRIVVCRAIDAYLAGAGT
ncbi:MULTISPECIES: hypothetical protein [Variovorax]|uniref:hypothetical protein n=1 Tax=Variovorax TaxID=34072 RepID=UPI00285485E6|nr:hypothetical protein [Variovorax sp. 3319]MDR6887832.1 hypothetical protein [Variovorax sp. 3319]